MQTSFMHPPFGFALFYLRSIAPPSVRSSDIYWGAIPWVVLQLILVIILIAFPQLVTMFLSGDLVVDPNFEIIMPGTEGGTDLSAPPAMDLNQPPAIDP
jgi:hypothetical protein